MHNGRHTFDHSMEVCNGISGRHVVVSESAKAHIYHVQPVSTLIHDHGFITQLLKSDFFSKTTNFLGHVINSGQLAILQNSIDASYKLDAPSYITEF